MTPFNIFTSDLFTATSLSAAIDKFDYVPTYLQSIPGLIEPDPVRTEVIWIEERTNGAVILPFSPRGGPPHETGADIRTAKAFKTLRYGDRSVITASELFGVRGWNTEINLKDAATEVARRQQKMKNNFSKTREFHLLNLVTQAKVIDADASTVMYDWATEFGQSIPAEVDFDLDNATPASGVLRQRCAAVRRSMQVALKGVGTISDVIGLCGDTFWDQLTSHKEIVQTYLNWNAASDLRGNVGREWSEFRFGDITFVNYRNSDDATVGIGTTKCKFVPTGTGIFRWALAPGEAFSALNTIGQDMYSIMVRDTERDAWVAVEAYTYPLPVCTMPSVLYSAKNT